MKWLCGLRTQAGQLLVLDLAVSLSSWLLPESLSLDLPWVTGILLTQGLFPLSQEAVFTHLQGSLSSRPESCGPAESR